MNTKEFESFEADIIKHGLQNPIVLFEGKILDGRCRALVADKHGLEIQTINFEDLETSQSPLEYIMSVNLYRRHLSDDERNQLEAKMAELKAKEE